MRFSPAFSRSSLLLACAITSACGGGGGREATNAQASTEEAATRGVVDIVRPSATPASAPAPTPVAQGAAQQPRTAAFTHGPLDAAQQELAARFNVVVLGMYPSMGVPRMQSMIDRLRAINPGIKLAQYVALNELAGSAQANEDGYPLVQAVGANDWWVRDTAGKRMQWTDEYNNYEVNLTDWAPADAAGRRWPQWKAEFDSRAYFSVLNGLDYVFNDNVFVQPRNKADWMRNGTDQAPDNPVVAAGLRKGFVNYWNALRARHPGIKIIGNADSDLGTPEYKGQLEGAVLECMMGKTWSLETWGGWDTMMARYRKALANTRAPNDVIFHACSQGAVNPALVRYGLASALMENGYFSHTADNEAAPYWADEFAAQIGTAAEAPPTAPTASGIWMRRYTQGVALVNPSTTRTLSIDIGDGYKHIAGKQDPTINNGQPQRVVSLPPRSGLLMVRP